MEEKLKKIVNHYGVMNQLKYIHSEYFELDEAMMEVEYIDVYKGSPLEKEFARMHVSEEIADIMVMLKQFQLYCNISDESIKEIMNEKINRQIERIKNEKN